MPITVAQATSFTKPTGDWKTLQGNLIQVSVGRADNIWGVNAQDQIWQFRNRDWIAVPGALVWVAAGADGTVWGVNRGGQVFRREGNDWAIKPGKLVQIGVGSAQHVVGVNIQGQPWKWTGSDWQLLPGNLVNIDIAADGTMYGINRDGTIFRWQNNDWAMQQGRLQQISVGSANYVCGINAAGDIYRTFADAKDWLLMPGKLRNVSIGADGTLFGVTPLTSLVEWESENVPARMLRQPVTVLSYNTHLFGGSNAIVGNFVQKIRGLTKDEIVFEDDIRTEGIARRIETCGADIVALMEVWAYDRQVHLAERLKAVYPFSFHPGKGVIYKNTSGLLLLSKFPLVDTGFREFDNLHGEDSWSEKGVLVATVYLWQRYAFRIGITHAGTDMGGETQPQIYQVQNETVFAKEPALMIGDFNVHKRKYDVMNAILNKAGAHDAWLATGGTMDNGNTINLAKNRLDQHFTPNATPADIASPGEDHLDRIDYAYVKTDGQATTLTPTKMAVLTDWQYNSPRRGGPMDLSDHYPIILEMESTLDTGLRP